MDKLAVRVVTLLDFTILLPINLVLIVIRSIRFTIREKWSVLYGFSLFFQAIFAFIKIALTRFKTGTLERS